MAAFEAAAECVLEKANSGSVAKSFACGIDGFAEVTVSGKGGETS